MPASPQKSQTNPTKETPATLIAFTDGACVRNGKPDARGSFAAVWPEHPELNAAFVMLPKEKQTNNRAELHAVLLAIHQADAILDPARKKTLIVYTDSKLTIDSLVSWMPKWKRNGWVKATDNKPVMNVDLLKLLDMKLQARKTTFVHVRAHTSGKDYASLHNHAVDRLAVTVLSSTKRS